MPKPVFIICAREIVEDKSTNLLSIFTVIEKIEAVASDSEIPRGRDGRPGIPPQFQQIKVVAVWMQQDGDRDGEFEHEFQVDVGDFHRDMAGNFTFDDAPLKRFQLTLVGFPIPDESCVGYVRSRIRRPGSVEWQIQEYPIPITITHLPVAE